MALSKIDTTNMIEDVPQSKLDNNINFRNIIFNGDMSIAQRSTSVAGVVSQGYRVHDRWRGGGTIPGTWTWSQSTDVPTGQGFAYSQKWDCTTASASLSASDTFVTSQRFEGQMLQYLKKGTANAQSLTLSFWVKSSKTGTYIAELLDNDNSRHISKSYTINSANTWEKKTITYAGDTTGAFDNDNALSLYLQLWLAAGTNFQSGTLATSWSSRVEANVAVGNVNLADSTSNEWYVTGVQLEAGQTASEFEFLPTDVNLLRCQRYCYAAMNYGNGTADDNKQFSCRYSTAGSFINIFYPTQMRLEPSITYSQNSGALSNDYSTPSSLQFYDSDDVAWYIYNVLADAEL